MIAFGCVGCLGPWPYLLFFACNLQLVVYTAPVPSIFKLPARGKQSPRVKLMEIPKAKLAASVGTIQGLAPYLGEPKGIGLEVPQRASLLRVVRLRLCRQDHCYPGASVLKILLNPWPLGNYGWEHFPEDVGKVLVIVRVAVIAVNMKRTLSFKRLGSRGIWYPLEIPWI